MNRPTLIAAAAVVLIGVSATWLLKREYLPLQAPEPVNDTSAKTRRDIQSDSKARKSNWDILTRDDLPRHQRLEIARRISGVFDPDDAKSLFTALRHKPAGGSEEDWYVILNEIMEQMRRNGVGSGEYSLRLGELAADPNQPEVVRDYAIQHLAGWIAPANPDQVPHEKNFVRVGQSLRHITTAIQDPAVSQSSIPGTALLMLADITANLPPDLINPAWQSLDGYLDDLFSGENPAPLTTRVSAIQAVARTRQVQYLPTIRSFASDETTDPSVRLSSIASLGFYASPEDRALLEGIVLQDDRYKFAAQTALQRITRE